LGDANAPEYISNKLLGLANFKYLSSRKGVHVVGALLGLSKPWPQIAEHLGRDKKALMQMLDDAVKRRNDIVHRADRAHTEPGGEAQDITFAWAQQAVDTIRHICLALDELVGERVKQISALATQ